MTNEPTIAAATANMSGHGNLGPRHASLAKRIEQAMSHAVLDALAEGIDINDSAEILRRKHQARLAVLEESKAV